MKLTFKYTLILLVFVSSILMALSPRGFMPRRAFDDWSLRVCPHTQPTKTSSESKSTEKKTAHCLFNSIQAHVSCVPIPQLALTEVGRFFKPPLPLLVVSPKKYSDRNTEVARAPPLQQPNDDSQYVSNLA